jgi:pimeloyl-ACP methyl ester carboxylesterase
MTVRIHRPSPSLGTVFCFHSFAGTGEDFLGLAGHLARIGLTSICPDLIGRGRSACAGDANAYTLTGYLQSVSALMQFAEKKVFFIGTSFGALLALAITESSPNAATAFVFHEPLLSSSSSIAAGLPRILAAAKLRFASEGEAEDYAMARIPTGLPEDIRLHIARERFRSFPDGYGFALDAAVEKPLVNGRLPDFNVESQLAKSRIPTLVLTSEETISSAIAAAVVGHLGCNNLIFWQPASLDNGGDECFRILDDQMSSRISEFLAPYC